MTGGTIMLNHVFRAPRERLYRAFLDPDAMVKWLPPRGFVGKVIESDPRLGGGYRMSFKNFATSEEQIFGGEYVELVSNERIAFTDRFENPAYSGTMETIVTFRTVSCGTEVEVAQRGIPEAIPTEMCTLGWQESFDQLALLVEVAPPGEA